jgi:hypothetical protein
MIVSVECMKIWTEVTKDEIRISTEALFKGMSSQFGPRTIEMNFENAHLMNFIHPKRRTETVLKERACVRA